MWMDIFKQFEESDIWPGSYEKKKFIPGADCTKTDLGDRYDCASRLRDDLFGS